MAVILCNSHGRQGCTSTSPDFAKAIIEKTDFNESLVILELNILGDKFITLVDENFLKKIDIPLAKDGKKISIDDEDVAFDIFLTLPVICGKCFSEYLQLHNLTLLQ